MYWSFLCDLVQVAESEIERLEKRVSVQRVNEEQVYRRMFAPRVAAVSPSAGNTRAGHAVEREAAAPAAASRVHYAFFLHYTHCFISLCILDSHSWNFSLFLKTTAIIKNCRFLLFF